MVSLLLCLLWIMPLPLVADEDPLQARRRDLEEIERSLLHVEQDLHARQRSREVLAAEVERYERDIAQLARADHELDTLLEEQVGILATVQHDLDTERAHLARERRALAALLRSAHALGSQEHLRLLLNQDDLARVGRILSYYGYLNRYRVQRLEAFAARARRLEGLRLEVAEETQRLARLAARQRDTRERLARAMAQRTALLADLDQTIASRADRLAALREDAEALRALVTQLERQAARLPESEVVRQRLIDRRGRLPWPLAGGRLLERFDSLKGEGGPQRWDGVLLAAPEGSAVRAVHHGRVVYADWLRGFGLLMVLDHGDDYMTLYGHNQTLLKEPGEWIESGEIIALSGSSGGQRRAGLYFAIRYRGRPVNPEPWCHSVHKLGARRPLCRPDDARGQPRGRHQAGLVSPFRTT